jgi:hypothetical protein
MAEHRSNEIYLLELYGRGRNNVQAYADLIAYDTQGRTGNIYVANLINTDGKMKLFTLEMQEVKTGTVRRAEGSSRDDGHESYNVFTPNKNYYDTYDTKIEDMLNTLFIAKCAKPNIRERQDWQMEEDKRLEEGESPRRAPEELVLAWDGNIRDQIYKVLDDRYNTPMLEEWKDYIINTLIEDRYYRPLTVKSYGREYTLEAGLLAVTEKQLETIISEGIASYELNFAVMEDGRSDDESILKDCNGLDDYLTHFAGELGQRIQENTELRFDPTKEEYHPALIASNLHANQQGITGLFNPQADTLMGSAKVLTESNYVMEILEMGSGKTPVGATLPYVAEAMINQKEAPNPFRAMVLSPSIMVDKWKREIKERVPGAKVYEIRTWRDVLPLMNQPYKPTEIEYYVMSTDASKQSYPEEPIQDWRHGVEMRGERDRVVVNEDWRDAKQNGEKVRIRMKKDTVYRDGRQIETTEVTETGFHCPQCGGPLYVKKDRMSDEHFFQSRKAKKWAFDHKAENHKCKNMVKTIDLPKHLVLDKTVEAQECGFVLWQPQRLKKESLNRKVSPAWMINKKLRRGFFKYLIADEAHELKSGESDRATAFGQLINHTKKQILLTGTLLGGMSSDIFYLLARLDAKRLKKESIGYEDMSIWIQRYGVYEHKFKEREGETRKKSGRQEKPGVSPQVFSRFLISNCAFLELSDLATALPTYREEPIFVDFDELHKEKYSLLEADIGSTMRQNVAMGGMKHVSTYINRLYQYADMPYNQAPITYFDDAGIERVLATPYSFDSEEFTPTKYHALLQKLEEEIEERGRKVLVYARFTGNNAVDTWLYDKLKEDGYNVGILRSSKSYDGIQMPAQKDRESWLRDKMEKHDWDVLICNSRLVSVGLDLLMFPTIIYYQMDYSTYNYMQSSRRSWRIKQTEPVEVYTMVYRDTIQADVLDQIARKIDAAMALQGKFSEEGLRAMADSGDGINALAKKLMSEGRLDNVDSIEDRWKRINQSYEQMQNSSMEVHSGYIMNPLGIEEVKRIAAGIVTKLQDDVKAGKISSKDLEAYLNHLGDMFMEMENASDYNKGLKKKDQIVEGQAMLALF